MVCISRTANCQAMHARAPVEKLIKLPKTPILDDASLISLCGSRNRSGFHSSASSPHTPGRRLYAAGEISICVPLLMGIDVICSPDLVVIGKAKGSTSSRPAILAVYQLIGSSLIDSFNVARVYVMLLRSATANSSPVILARTSAISSRMRACASGCFASA